MDWVLLSIYLLSMTLILFYSFIQLSLVISYKKSKKKKKTEINILDINRDDIPFVTVQLPVYNEKYVIERLIDVTAKLKYPRNKLEIQILDDSSDDTTTIIRQKLKSMKDEAACFKLIRREDRVGFKAGALNYGMNLAQGELFAIFDADFIPNSDFLLKTVPYFSGKEVGVVQTRWGHINKDYSLLTKIQAFALDAHFTIEQVGRNNKDYFVNFNGTAGVWRRKCIEDAGGWQYDTITEDLDLSYRAQFKKWKFLYLEEIESPAELPVAMSAMKSQQFRWNKGAAQNFRKMKKRLLSEKMSFSKRIHAFAHLLNSSIFILVFLIGVLSVPLLYTKSRNTIPNEIFNFLGVFTISFIILSVFYWNSYKPETPKSTFSKFFAFGTSFLTFLATSMGLALHNSIAVIEGHMGVQSSFIRTPKFNVIQKRDSWHGNKYRIKKIGIVTLIEGLLFLYFGFGLGYSLVYGQYGFVPFIFMLVVGYGYIFLKSVFEPR